MQVAKHKVVSIDYTLTDNEGQMIDSSQGSGPLDYVHGEGNIIPGLEVALDGKAAGDRIEVSIAPVDGYGELIEELRQVVSRDTFGDTPDLEVGMRFRVPTDDGGQMVFRIVGIEGDAVTIDGNHELAGVTLNFDVTIQAVRDASPEEIEHGHAHSDGEHH
jgi:FKBP-type peptidyl-prolyl cis-trans isomerase SlyD